MPWDRFVVDLSSVLSSVFDFTAAD